MKIAGDFNSANAPIVSTLPRPIVFSCFAKAAENLCTSSVPAHARLRRRCTLWTFLLLPLLMAASCRSYIVHVTVVNHTGAAINLLEVDYPSASFGVDTLASGAEYHYHLQLEYHGPIKVQYTEGEKQQYTSTGPTVREGQHGQLEIVLDPNGKTEFHARLTPPN